MLDIKNSIWFIIFSVIISNTIISEAAPPIDLRIIVDTSGSMRRTDPLNLRMPALRLVAGLLPQGSKAGIYIFDQNVVNIVPPALVNSAWQWRARRSAEQIHSRGLFTDIGAALERAIVDWNEPTKDWQRKILLMTDGMVDISKDPTANAAAREQVINKTLPKIIAAGAVIYTIALSDEADHELLRKFSLDTNGWFEQASDSQLLQRLFLRIFTQAVQRETLPLKDNRFLVDNTVKELTLVVFHRQGANPTALITPEGKQYTKENAAANIRWAAERDYDMVTLDKPTSGSWQVEADTDPDNQVMIVTDLNLEMDPVPSHALVGEHLDLMARLMENGKIVTDQNFLQLLNFTVTRTAENDEHEMRPLHNDGVTPDLSKTDGIFSVSLDDLLRPGAQELHITLESATFQRELRYSVNLYPNGVETVINEEGEQRQLSITPVPEIVDPPSLALTATITTSEGSIKPLNLTRGADNSWTAPLPKDNGHYIIMFQARGRTPQGRQLSFIPTPINFGNNVATPLAAARPTPLPAANIKEHTNSSPFPIVTIGITLAAVNVVFFLAFWFGRRWWHKRNEAAFIDLNDQIEPPINAIEPVNFDNPIDIQPNDIKPIDINEAIEPPNIPRETDFESDFINLNDQFESNKSSF